MTVVFYLLSFVVPYTSCPKPFRLPHPIWPPHPPLQIMYAIRTRNGTVYMKMKKLFGDMSALEVRRH